MESTFGASEFPPVFEEQLKRALSLDLPYAERFLSRDGSLAHASVLALFARARHPDPENPSGISLLVTRRTESVESHKGQMAFPGGRCELDEMEGGHFEKTALRETEEEVGIPPNAIRILGSLPPLVTITLYWVMPFVGISNVPVEDLALRLNPAEIAEAIWVPWSVLSDPATYQKEMIQRGAIRFPTHVYQVGEHRVWGATGAMIKNLLDRLQSLS
jgi:8-oxo-dGTP pyrophosphatase MutT (NUDIX family)